MLQPMLAMLQDVAANAAGHGDNFLALFGAALGTGATVIGASFGIARIGASATEGMARQPEAAGNIQTAAIILAALIEGAALFALVIMLLFKLL